MSIESKCYVMFQETTCGFASRLGIRIVISNYGYQALVEKKPDTPECHYTITRICGGVQIQISFSHSVHLTEDRRQFPMYVHLVVATLVL